TVVPLAGEHGLGVGQIADEGGADPGIDVDALGSTDGAAVTLGVGRGLDLEHEAGDQRTMSLEEFLEIVAVDGQAPVEAELDRKRDDAAEIPPARAVLSAEDAAGPRRPPRAEEALQRLPPGSTHPA